MTAQWYCMVLDQELGPMSADQLKELVRNHNLVPSDMVRRHDSPWVPARMVKGLFDGVALAEPATPPPVSSPPASSAAPRNSSSLGNSSTVDNADEVSHDHENVLTSDYRSAQAEDDEDFSPTQIVRGLMVGSTLGNYVILEKLGEGGMGMVLKATHRRMDRIVALKVLHGEATRSTATIKRFQQEAKAAARLIHPNIVTALDADEANGAHFLVMEYVDGLVLSELLNREGALPIRDAVNYTLQAARGLAYAHSEGVVHRDIKPGNLLLDKRGTVKILDMGLARVEETAQVISDATAAESLTRAGQVLGTLDYMSPEQAEDASHVDHRADIYSLGCTMFRLLTGRPPYTGETVINKIVAHRDHAIPSLCEARKGVSADLDAVFRLMVAKRQEDRYQSMQEVIIDLEGYLANGTVRSNTMRQSAALSTPTKSDLSKGGGLGASGAGLCAESGNIVVPTTDSQDAFNLLPVEDELPTRPALNRPVGKPSGPTVRPGRPGAAPSTSRPAATGPSHWFCQVMGEQLGPLSLQQLAEMKRKKQIMPDDLVRRSDEDQWRPAADVPGLF